MVYRIYVGDTEIGQVDTYVATDLVILSYLFEIKEMGRYVVTLRVEGRDPIRHCYRITDIDTYVDSDYSMRAYISPTETINRARARQIDPLTRVVVQIW